MSKVCNHRRKLSNIPRSRVFRLGEQINDACGNLAHDPCPDSWMTLLFQLESAYTEIRHYCPEISVETDHTLVREG